MILLHQAGEGRGWSQGGRRTWSLLHTADNQQQLGHTLQVKTIGRVLGDMPRLRGTWGRINRSSSFTQSTSPHTADRMLVKPEHQGTVQHAFSNLEPYNAGR